MKFHVINLGCRVNRVESDGFIASLKAHAGELVEASEADAIIINTCTVTGEAEKKTRKAVRKALRDNIGAIVVVTGCAASIDPDTYRALDDRVELVFNKKKVVEEVLGRCGYSGKNTIDESSRRKPIRGNEYPLVEEHKTLQKGTELQHETAPEHLRFGEGFMSRPGIKIQDGCDNACSFCIVHKARGRAQSRASHEILEEARMLGQAGAKELVLTGIDLGSYKHGNINLLALLEELLASTEGLRIRLSSIEPHTVDIALADLMIKAEGRLCRYLHIPLQSGSNRILSEMKRRYTKEQFEDTIKALYEKIPELSLSTDIIVGFPSESQSDFNESKSLAQKYRFSKIHVFPYSPRKNTPAASRTDHIEPFLKKARTKELRALGNILRKEDRKRREGTIEWVLVESKGCGMSESYHRIELAHDKRAGELIQLVL